MVEQVKRIAPSNDTLRRLYVYSGNLCAFPNCDQLMVDIDGEFSGQVCHIEAAMPGGERFNPSMTNEQRSHFDNLILLCYRHHKKTDNVSIYTVRKLKEMKKAHERKFSEDVIIQHMLSTLKDYTKMDTFTEPKNLNVLFKNDDPRSKFKRNAEEVRIDVEVFCYLIDNYLVLSPYTRKVFVQGLERAHHPYGNYRLDEETLYVDFAEVAKSFGKRGNDREIWDSVQEIEANGLMHVNEVNVSDDWLKNMHVYSRAKCVDDYDTNIWLLLKKYCKKNRISLQGFFEQLDFSGLDE